LVSFTPDELAELLRDEIPYISSKRIERDDWLGQARALVHSREQPETSQPDAEETPVPSTESQETEAAKESRESWRELADFFVSFGLTIGPEGEERYQTKVHHSQADKAEQWDGIVADQLIDWMFSQTNLPQPAKVETQVEKEEAAAPYDVRIEILEVQLSEVPTPFGAREKNLKGRVHFQLSGPEAEPLTAQQLPLRVELHTVNLENQSSALVASDSSQLQPSRFEYTSKQEFRLPGLGRYELHSIVLLLPPGDMMACHQGPIFKVVL
jgi:hypothetical protein